MSVAIVSTLTRGQAAAHLNTSTAWLDFLIEECAIVEPLTSDSIDALKRRREDVEQRAARLD